ELTLHIKKEENGEIVEGSLNCAACKVDYPIEDAIPNMLPPALRS
ncbi:MAG: Trm112 family protein, partial [SAR202 cluster bacterium]|nr:Trm112 family protein [SAR202 cluster bacterium]